VVAVLVVMSGWSIVSATYFAFHDDVLARLIAREASMQSAYEDRIADMRLQVDRVTSRQLLDQEQFEQKLQQLLHRQAALESRASTLGSVADPSTTGSIKPALRGNGTAEPRGMLKSSLTDEPKSNNVPSSRAEARPQPPASGRVATSADGGSIERTLAGVQASLDRMELRQAGSLNTLEQSYDGKARRIQAVLSDLGLDPGRASAMGGPFVPLKTRSDANVFETQLQRVNLARGQIDRLNRILAATPIRAPVTGEIDTTSKFGIRVDPFLGRPAMHTGVDFRGNIGDPVHATAAGTITHAGWSGGYGEMVEIDHGNGMSTRYGHLSAIDVSVGQTVKAGEIIGLLGSSGRSTGPHLHYETRVEGEAVDPERFLRAGVRLADII
jgi:murein DD-endopeptidase MepM/ murein hydrolase activator NlpD